MEHLNYCRQMVKQLTAVRQIPSVGEDEKLRATHLIDLAGASQKFILPDGGMLLEDNELKALDGAESLRLPHPFVALEWPDTKSIIFAREHESSGDIAVTAVVHNKTNGCWDEWKTVYMSNTPHETICSRRDGKAEISCMADQSIHENDVASRAVRSVLMVVLSFLNALQCSNVHIARSLPRSSGKKVKAALPFDTYHVLTVDVPGRAGDGVGATGSHRSPREHLRRGHIRRLSDGRRLWINATVVSAGRGAGVVKKDYALRLAA